jgi:hypothetical protein
MVVDIILSAAWRLGGGIQYFIDVIAVDEQPLVAARTVIFTQNLSVAVVVVSPRIIGVNKKGCFCR